MTPVNEERGAENTQEEKQMEGNSEGGGRLSGDSGKSRLA